MTNAKTTTPYGAWPSPITADLITGGVVGIGQVSLDDGMVYWTELRPSEGGRTALLRRLADGSIEEVTPEPINVRSRVHEYGGASYVAAGDSVYYVDGQSQQIMRLRPGGEATALTDSENSRYADLLHDAPRRRLVAVEEVHGSGAEPVNRLSAVDLESGSVSILAQGADFYSAPRLSPDGGQLAWIEWDHPNMPWDGTRLRLAHLAEGGAVEDDRVVAGGTDEAIFQPEFAPDGRLHFVSDRTGFWNLYRLDGDSQTALCPMQAEFGMPYWVFGMRTYGFVDARRILCCYAVNGAWRLGLLDAERGAIDAVETDASAIAQIACGGGLLCYLAGTPTRPDELRLLNLETGKERVVRRAAQIEVPGGFVSEGEEVSFPTADGETAYGYFYAPANADHQARSDELPPLIVKSHGGPTGQTERSFNLKIQYWTSRGFAVLDVNYRGSSGYGRDFRRALDGLWGIADVEDSAAGALFLADKGLVDRDRLIVTGGSAGGYTTLCALTFTDTFRAGASHYGVGDLEALARDTHKFESRYLDRLVGPWPEAKAVYRDRSPIHAIDRLNCPVIFLQGSEDKVVPPNQADDMVAALDAKGLPVAYVLFDGEGHGFRQAENIKRALVAELSFYGQVFGFEPPGIDEPVPIRNL